MAASVTLAAFPLQSQALTFNFEFDNTDDGTVTPPIVGTGTFSFNGDPGNGTFALTSLAPFNFSYNIGTATFTNADILTPVANVTAIISTDGSDRFVNFGGTGGGPFGGSIDFRNGTNFLTFQPGGGSFYQASGGFFGTYAGTIPVTPASVPEPTTTLGLLVLGGLGVRSLIKGKKA
ncbi:PEP-CTERM sorting domain-containing protein [Crocosphaera sp. XPORK-15E]|uniref:PEP-CTERM sorting domain-containing protein n=1 Tax=Crocosphaera sp. XPORK-15E TaxID=3110247 RepID=UPI002B213A70|nr:PEP-CTERM sorting domain-containing protein [Crocosphaera sp. XPORK-15E]MEA5536414.1 PEP-CTERM sorting domain-containing protein [Crocosphaera sp. XPORK-15E]